ncbi:MAG: mechanosensitive ion channel domain-containing protein [Oceanicoccus sp.]
MNHKRPVSLHAAIQALFVTLLLLTSTSLIAQDSYVAATTGELDVEIEDLTLMLLPLSQKQLEIEASAWHGALTDTLHRVTKLEIQSKQLGRRAKLLKEAAGDVEDIVKATENDDIEDVADAEVELKKIGDKLHTAPEMIEKISNQASSETVQLVIEKGKEAETEKSDLIQTIASLRLEQTRMVNRLNTVLDALEKKGGDVTELRLFTTVVGGIKISVNDSSTAWASLYQWIKSEDGGQLLFMNILKFIVALVVVIMLSKVAGSITDRLTRHNSVSKLLENFLKVAARRTVLFIGFIMIVPIIGINIGPVLAVIGAAGLVVGLALQGTLSNFASGVLILIYRPYDINDVIEVGIGGVSGIVSSMTLISTTIKTLDNKLITVPNNAVWNDSITNITGSDKRRVDLVFGISYGDDFTVAQKIIHGILSNHSKVLDEPKPNVRVHELADSSVNIICRPWVKTDDYWEVYWDITEAVKREFDGQGVSIPFPQRDVHFFPVGELDVKSTENSSKI